MNGDSIALFRNYSNKTVIHWAFMGIRGLDCLANVIAYDMPTSLKEAFWEVI